MAQENTNFLTRILKNKYYELRKKLFRAIYKKLNNIKNTIRNVYYKNHLDYTIDKSYSIRIYEIIFTSVLISSFISLFTVLYELGFTVLHILFIVNGSLLLWGGIWFSYKIDKIIYLSNEILKVEKYILNFASLCLVYIAYGLIRFSKDIIKIRPNVDMFSIHNFQEFYKSIIEFTKQINTIVSADVNYLLILLILYSLYLVLSYSYLSRCEDDRNLYDFFTTGDLVIFNSILILNMVNIIPSIGNLPAFIIIFLQIPVYYLLVKIKIDALKKIPRKNIKNKKVLDFNHQFKKIFYISIFFFILALFSF